MARKCGKLCGFSSPVGECKKPAGADCPAGLPTNEQKIRAMSLDEMAKLVALFTSTGGDAICINAPRCEQSMALDRLIPDEWCEECAKAWLQQVAEEESAW